MDLGSNFPQSTLESWVQLGIRGRFDDIFEVSQLDSTQAGVVIVEVTFGMLVLGRKLPTNRPERSMCVDRGRRHTRVVENVVCDLRVCRYLAALLRNHKRVVGDQEFPVVRRLTLGVVVSENDALVEITQVVPS